MRRVALPKAPAEALHVTGHAPVVREAGMPAEGSVSEHPEPGIAIIIMYIVHCAFASEKLYNR